MGSCFTKKKKNTNLELKQPGPPLETNIPVQQIPIPEPNNEENREKEDFNPKKEDLKPEKEPKDSTKKPLKATNQSNNKSKISTTKKKNKKKTNSQLTLPPEKELEAVQEIIKHKQTLIEKKNLELKEITVNKEIFLRSKKGMTNPNEEEGESAAKLAERIQRIVEKNNQVHRTLDDVNNELEACSVGLRKGSAKSEEIRDSVRKVLSRMANFDKDFERIQNPEISYSPLKIPKTNSKVITNFEIFQGYNETPLLKLRKLLEEKNNQMDERKTALEKLKNGEELDEKMKSYRAIFQKELEQIQMSDLDKAYMMNSDVILGFEDHIKGI